MPSLSLGTAQFGMDYGVTNSSGSISRESATKILDRANQENFVFIDTAQSYGYAEKLLGLSLPRPNPFAIISKLPSQSNYSIYDSSSQYSWQKSLENTLHQLNVSSLDGLLLHSSADLVRPDAHILLDWLLSIQHSGLVRRIGVSIYQGSDLDHLPLSDIQIVQLPCSLYDQRLILDNTVQRLVSHGISIHVRSIYLQGLLVTEPHRWPPFLTPAFKAHHQRFSSWAHCNDFSLVQLAIQWARTHSWIESVVVGVTNLVELDELCNSWHSINPWDTHDPHVWSWQISNDLDPRTWNML